MRIAINRFRSSAQQTQILKDLKEGKIDIIIGTHRLVSKDVQYKDLGILIIDEEQKFGVNVKDKLKTLRASVDTLTLTATPIPRTLQFSLMGARDLSIISTPPPNRYPVSTMLQPYDEVVIRGAIEYELSRGGQVYFLHDKVKNIEFIADMVRKLVPGVKVGVGHGQLEGHKLEEVMMDFIEGNTDVLVCTTIVENGLDIPNANTIIVNEAQNFGLSDLHQLRGRVGRSNKKAYCYLLAPSPHLLPDLSRKRLQAIEQFSDRGVLATTSACGLRPPFTFLQRWTASPQPPLRRVRSALHKSEMVPDPFQPTWWPTHPQRHPHRHEGPRHPWRGRPARRGTKRLRERHRF